MSSEESNKPRRPREDKPDTEEESSQQTARDRPTSPARPPGSKEAAPGDKTRPMAPYEAPEAGGPLPELDEGPRAGPLDEVQEAIFAASQEGKLVEVEVDELPEPVPDLDEGPRPGPVDEVQEALFEAAREGAPTDVDFEKLPGPGATKPKKIIRFKKEPPPPKPEPPAPEEKVEEAPDRPEIRAEPVPLPDFPEVEPTPRVADFWLLLALFVSFRGLTLFLLRPGGYLRDWSDFDTYFGIAALSDYSVYPFLDFWLEWPPLIPWLAVGAYKLSLLLPPWPDDPRLWFILILGSIFLLFEVGNFFLIYRLARRLFDSATVISRVLWLYAGLFPPVYAMLGFFDGVALFFILLALDLLLADRRFYSAMAVGVGFMVKLIPALMLPVALRRLWYQYRADNREAGIEMGLYAVTFGLVVLVLLGPFLIGGPEWVVASARSIVGRSSWETVWAVIEGYYGFGFVEGVRQNPNETNFAVHQVTEPALIGLRWLVTLAFAGLYGYLFTRPADYRRPRNMVAFSGLTVAIFLLYSKGYSPQFLVYLLPFILLLFPTGRGLVYALVLTGLNVLEQPIFFVMLPQANWLLVFVVVTRFLIMALVALEFSLILWPLEQRWPRLIRLRRQVPQLVGGGGSLALIILIPVLIHTYHSYRLEVSPVSGFVNFMETQTIDADYTDAGEPRLLLNDQTTYRRLYPHLNQGYDLQLTGGVNQGFTTAPTTAELLVDLDALWILPTGAGQQALRDAADRRGRRVTTFIFEELGEAVLYSFRPNPPPFIAPARFTGGIELVTYEVTREAGAINVTLFWRPVSLQAQSYTVFTHLLDGNGQRVAGHDSLPANGTAPTNSWPVNAVQVDPHRIDLPSDLSPGEYTVKVGLYNSFGDRLNPISPEGIGYTNQAIPLETLQLP